MTANGIMILPAKTIISRPILAALGLVVFFWLGSIVLAQGASEPRSDSSEYLFLWGTRIVMVVTLITIAATAVYNTLRKAALNEYKELAEVRKGKLIEKELENEKLRSRLKDLESENESLEKKNLRLQEREDDRK